MNAPKSTPPAAGEAAHTPTTDPIKTLLPWCGMMGHRVVLAAPASGVHAKLYGGWYALCEANAVSEVVDLFKPGYRVFQKVAKRGKYGAVREEWQEVTEQARAALAKAEGRTP